MVSDRMRHSRLTRVEFAGTFTTVNA